MEIIEKKDLFLSRVYKDKSGCWTWMAAKNKAGYGIIGYKGKTYLAHRFSHLLFKGQIPFKMCVCHKCDTPSCVNPDHLFLGTNQDNHKVVDITNKRFGKLVALRIIENKHITSQTCKFWECICDCGNTKIIRGTFLRDGTTKSCGCEKGAIPRKIVDGKLTCSKCRRLLDSEKFNNKKRAFCGKESACKECLNAQQYKKYREDVNLSRMKDRKEYWTNPEKHRKRVREYSYLKYGYKPKSLHIYVTIEYKRLRSRIKQQNRIARYQGKKIIKEDWISKLIQYGHKCNYCGSEDKIVMDHVIPLSRGGEHSIDNIVPCCRECNSSKGKKLIQEWGGKHGPVAHSIA